MSASTFNKMLTIRCRVPCESMISGWMRFHNVPLDRFVEQSRQYERAYLAWETVRKVRNPFFAEGTGFEGYFVEICHSPDEMLSRLLEIGHQLLASNYRLYRHQFRFRSRLMQTLVGDNDDPRGVAVWADLLGATLGKLRCNVYLNQDIYRFQNETYWTVYRLPPISYNQCEGKIEQQYRLARFRERFTFKPCLQLNLLGAADYDAGLVVSTIGRFGHPLVREYLHEACQTP